MGPKISGAADDFWISPIPAFPTMEACEADSGIRTRGLDLGGVALCQLSYVRR
jgi:hypothetical protein